MYDNFVNRWLKSKHYYNEIIKFNVTNELVNNFADKNNKYKYLGNKKLINYFLGNVNFNNLAEEKLLEPKYIKIYVRLQVLLQIGLPRFQKNLSKNY